MSFSIARRGRSKAKINNKSNMISKIETTDTYIRCLKKNKGKNNDKLQVYIMLHSYDRTSALSFLSAYFHEFWELSISLELYFTFVDSFFFSFI